MKKIDSLKTLRQEKKRLRIELAETENLLKEDYAWAIDSLKPANIISNTIGSFISSRKNGFVGDSISSSLGFVIKKVFLGRSSWILRLIIPQIVKNLSSNLIGDKKEDILSTVKTFIHNLRTKDHKSNGMYDSSTAQSHY